MVAAGTGRCAIGVSMRGALVIAALGIVASSGDGAIADDERDEASSRHHVREVADGHFVHVGRHEDMSFANGGDIANGGFVIGDEAVAVIDPGGGSETARALERALRQRTALPVTHVVLTHFHPDHVFGTHVFVDGDTGDTGDTGDAGDADGDVGTGAAADGAPAPMIVAHANHARAAVQRGAFYLGRYRALLDAGATLHAPTLEVAPGAPVEIDLGGRRLRVVAHPTAHTDNDVSVLDVDGGVLWAGDLVVAERTPSLDGRLTGWLGVLDALAGDATRLVVPGHGEPGSPAETIDPVRRYLEALLDDTRERLAAGERLVDAVGAAERAPRGPWVLFELHHPTNVTRAWTELEWE